MVVQLLKYTDRDHQHMAKIYFNEEKKNNLYQKMTINHASFISILLLDDIHSYQPLIDAYLMDCMGNNKFDPLISVEEKIKLINEFIECMDFVFEIEDDYPLYYERLKDDTSYLEYFFTLSQRISQYKKRLIK